MTTINHSNERNHLSKMVDAIKKHLGNLKTITLDGTSYPPAQLVKMLQRRIEAIDELVAAHAKLREAAATNREGRRELTLVVAALRHAVTVKFGASAVATLAEFGFAPRRVSTTDVETKAKAVVKLRLTREARHTMGKRQKAKIRGAPAPLPEHAPAPGSASMGVPPPA
jgi:hypothetical protein